MPESRILSGAFAPDTRATARPRMVMTISFAGARHLVEHRQTPALNWLAETVRVDMIMVMRGMLHCTGRVGFDLSDNPSFIRFFHSPRRGTKESNAGTSTACCARGTRWIDRKAALYSSPPEASEGRNGGPDLSLAPRLLTRCLVGNYRAILLFVHVALEVGPFGG